MPQLVTKKQLVEIVKQNKKSHKILLIHGVFDILHKGHLSAIQFAKKHCDILLLGIESDKLTRQIKGPKRPINIASKRAINCCSINMIDFVFYMPVTDNMNFDDGCHPYYKLKRKLGVPVVVSKNADDHYKKRILQERLNGIEVLIDPTPRVNSTTRIIEKGIKAY